MERSWKEVNMWGVAREIIGETEEVKPTSLRIEPLGSEEQNISRERVSVLKPQKKIPNNAMEKLKIGGGGPQTKHMTGNIGFRSTKIFTILERFPFEDRVKRIRNNRHLINSVMRPIRVVHQQKMAEFQWKTLCEFKGTYLLTNESK